MPSQELSFWLLEDRRPRVWLAFDLPAGSELPPKIPALVDSGFSGDLFLPSSWSGESQRRDAEIHESMGETEITPCGGAKQIYKHFSGCFRIEDEKNNAIHASSDRITFKDPNHIKNGLNEAIIGVRMLEDNQLEFTLDGRSKTYGLRKS